MPRLSGNLLATQPTQLRISPQTSIQICQYSWISAVGRGRRGEHRVLLPMKDQQPQVSGGIIPEETAKKGSEKIIVL